MQKEITLSEIKAVYTKDFETFGKMDPFLVFSIGKFQAKTETAHDAGKQPTWKATLVLNYFDEPTLVVKSFEQDLSTNQYMGEGKIEVKGLKNTGTLQFKVLQENNNVVGTVYCKYTLKTLPPTPILLIKNVKCDFYKETKFLLKTKPYFSVSCGGKTIVSEVKKEGNATFLSWEEALRIKVKEGEKITFSVEDKNDQSKKIFGYEAMIKQFRTLNGSKCFNVFDRSYEPLGTLEFDYETQHLVNKEESIKNEELIKKQSNEMYQITIEKIKGSLNRSGQDLYFKINLGPTMFKTGVEKNSKKDFAMELKQSFYSDRKQNKITFAAFDMDMTTDDYLGSAELSVQNLTTSQKTLSLKNAEGQHFGDILLTLTVKKVQCKQITLSDIRLKLGYSSDIIGKSDPYIRASIGGWSGRTETTELQDTTFKKSILLKFADEKQILFEIFDEDITSDELLYSEKFSIQGIRESGQQKILLKKQGQKDDKKNSELTFKYLTKNVFAAPKKEDLKKSQKIIPSEEPKTETATIKKQGKKQEQFELKKQENAVGKYQNQQKPKSEEKQGEIIKYSPLNKSRNTVKLPLIAEARNYGDKIFDKQSVATLQKSIHVYSMPKADRFGAGPKYSGQPSYYVQSSFKPQSGKGVGFGFGSKKQFPDWMQRNMKQNPAPGAYIGAHEKSNDLRPKGPTFGISYKFYEKVTIPKEKAYRSTERLKPLELIKK